MKNSIVRSFSVIALVGVAAYVSATYAQQSSGAVVEKKPTFQDFDLDGNEKISVSEAKLNQWLADNFTIVDVNKDGVITKQEYYRMVK